MYTKAKGTKTSFISVFMVQNIVQKVFFSDPSPLIILKANSKHLIDFSFISTPLNLENVERKEKRVT